MSQVNYKYNIGDTVQIKKNIHPSASCDVKKLAGQVVRIVDRTCYEQACYMFEGLEHLGWFTDRTIEGECEMTSNSYVIFVGDTKDDLQPISSVATKESAISSVAELKHKYPCVEAVFMPEYNEDINEVICCHYASTETRDVRAMTNKLIEFAEEDLLALSWKDIAKMCLKWMSEEDVAEMLRANDIIFEEEDD